MFLSIFFNNWDSLIRIVIVAIMIFFVIIFILRISGKRTLSKMNSFDFIITLALGSTVSTIILDRTISLSEGVLAFSLLVFLQFLLTWLSTRYHIVKKVITSQPVMILYKGNVLHNVIKNERVSIDELHQYARQQNIGDLSKIDIMVLETTGEITVIPKIGLQQPETLKEVKKPKNHYS